MADATFIEPDDEDGPGKTFVEGSGTPPSSAGYQPIPPSLVSDGYRMQTRLGIGAEAQVWLCTSGSGRSVAVKVYFREPKYAFEFNSEAYRRHFSPEWTVEVFQRGCDLVPGSDIHFEIMEYCAHGTLEELVARQGRTDEIATRILNRLTFCIKSLQGDRGKVVHGDIKPRNVLIRDVEQTELVLADFGLTIDLGERSNLSNFGQGTTAYNAPEIMRVKGAAADWWSLGMVMYTVLVGRGYYQIDADRWANQRTIEADLISRDISLDEIDRLDWPAPRRARWKLLLAGLLTRDPNKRWGATEVELWLAGNSPPVYRQLDADNQAGQRPQDRLSVEPFPFAGVGEFSSPEALGEAMAAQPADAARMLGGKGTKNLLTWLMDEVRSGDDYSELGQHNWDPDAKVAYFVAKMAPGTPLTFRGQPIGTPADLRRLVQNVEADVIDALFDAELLGSLANTGARSGYRMIQANWSDLVSRASEAARARAVPLSNEALRHIRQHALLLAASDSTVAERYVEDVRRRVHSAGLAGADEVGWFARLRADARL